MARFLRRDLALALLPALVAVPLALILAGQQPVRYTATATFELEDPNIDTAAAQGLLDPVGAGLTADQAISQIVHTFVRPPLLARTSRLLGGEVSRSRLAAMLSAGPQSISGVMSVTAHGSDARLVERIANAAVAAETSIAAQVARGDYTQAADADAAQLRAARSTGLDRITILEQQQTIADLRSLARSASPIVPLTAATVPRAPESPRPALDAAVAALIGLLLGGFLVLARSQASGPLTARILGGGALASTRVGTIPKRVARAGGPAGDAVAGGAYAEAFRILRTNLDFLAPHGSLRSLTVTGIGAESGTTSVAAALAQSYAAGGRRILLVDMNLHRAGLGDRLGAGSHPGMAEILLGRCSIGSATRELDSPRVGGREPRSGSLALIPAGSARAEAIDGFSEDRLERFLDRLRDCYDLILLDTSPVPATAEALTACAAADAVLLCVRAGHHALQEVAGVERMLSRLGRGPVAHVLVGAQEA